MPPTSGVGRVCTVRSFGSYTQPTRLREPTDERRGDERDERCRRADDQVGAGGWHDGMVPLVP